MQTKNVPVKELGDIVGADHVREATADDAVDGIRPSFVVEPGSVEETSEVMRLASEAGLAVVPRGGGTKTHWGNPPREADLILSTVRMNEVLEYVPGDQVVRVQAGMRLEDLQQRLAGSDQMLAVDPPETGATVGGVVAANSSGPSRLRYGTVRDLIIGITVVLPDGTVAKAGGKVVKNVAGYDLGKLFTGSLGTLGIITHANFRLHPLPETGRTVTVELPSTRAAGEAAQSIMHSQIVPSALELRWDGEARLLTLLVEGIEPAVEAQAETAAFLFRPFGEARMGPIEEAESVGPPEVDEGGAGVKISAPPAELPGVLDSALGAAERRVLTPKITGHAGTGVTYLALSGGEEEAQGEAIEELREIWVRRGGSVVVREAPVSLKKRLDVWGPAGDAGGLMRRVKEKFDPRGILNPGRFVGGI
jgi:glycolate oxidase FAD binding subunit